MHIYKYKDFLLWLGCVWRGILYGHMQRCLNPWSHIPGHPRWSNMAPFRATLSCLISQMNSKVNLGMLAARLIAPRGKTRFSILTATWQWARELCLRWDLARWFRVKLRASLYARPHVHRPDNAEILRAILLSRPRCGSVERSGPSRHARTKRRSIPSLWKIFHHGGSMRIIFFQIKLLLSFIF
jgi:hypothetical protein